MDSLKFVGGSKLMKKLQRTKFFVAYECVVFSSARSMTEKDYWEMLCESIIGVTGTSERHHDAPRADGSGTQPVFSFL
jgi:hypothetical protein